MGLQRSSVSDVWFGSQAVRRGRPSPPGSKQGGVGAIGYGYLHTNFSDSTLVLCYIVVMPVLSIRVSDEWLSAVDVECRCRLWKRNAAIVNLVWIALGGGKDAVLKPEEYVCPKCGCLMDSMAAFHRHFKKEHEKE